MKTVGIIAEFNPFHNGHKYLLEEARKITGANYCIVVMSGDFVQRGGPAMIDKYTRTQMALQNGADLVLELPVCYASGSAEFFARGAVALLDKLGVTDTLFFGSECGDIQPLMDTARFLSGENTAYQTQLKKYLKDGLSFPVARQQAALTENSTDFPAEILDSPNNILGIEYCKALLQRKSAILPQTLLRAGAGYHETGLLTDTFSSASAIRKAMCSVTDIEYLKTSVPADVFSLLAHLSPANLPIQENDFSLLLHYRLLLETSDRYTRFWDVNQDLSDKIAKSLSVFTNYNSFCHTLKSKNLTFSRISRCLLHILLDITNDDMMAYQNEDIIFYARLLGFHKSAGELLHSIKQNASVPLISKLADAASLLSETGQRMLQKDIQAAHIYNAVSSSKYSTAPISEYTRQIVILPN